MHKKKSPSRKAKKRKTARRRKAPQNTFPVERTPALQALAADVRKHLATFQLRASKRKRSAGVDALPPFIDCHLERLCELFLDRTKLVEDSIVGKRNQYIFLLCFIINPHLFSAILSRVVSFYDQKHAVWKVLCCSENVTILGVEGKLITKKTKALTPKQMTDYIAEHFVRIIDGKTVEKGRINRGAVTRYMQRFKKTRKDSKFQKVFEVVAGNPDYTIASMRNALGLSGKK